MPQCPNPPCPEHLRVIANLLSSDRDPPGFHFEQDIEQLVNSPFARDTVFASLAAPKRVGVGGLTMLEGLALASGLQGGTLGLAHPRGDIQLNEPLVAFPESRKRHTLAHEAAHLLDYAILDNPELRRARAARDSISDRFEEVPNESYASTDPGEHFAEAIATALLALDRAAANPEMAEQVLSAFDAGVPGTLQAANYLLDQPVFRHHPVNTARERARRQRLSAALLALDRVK